MRDVRCLKDGTCIKVDVDFTQPRAGYGLSSEEQEELRLLDEERRSKASDSARQPDRKSTAVDLAGRILFFGVLGLLALAWLFGTHTALDGEVDTTAASPVKASELEYQERRLDAMATRITELEERLQSTANAAAGSAPLPTATPYPTAEPQRWQGTGGRAQ